MASQAQAGEETGERSTHEFYRVSPHLPRRFDEPHLLHAYGSKPTHPVYRTSNQAYGRRAPTVHEMPTVFRGRSQDFSTHLGQCGMYRNRGLNTAVDRSSVAAAAGGGSLAVSARHQRIAFHEAVRALADGTAAAGTGNGR
ncbi:piercer of microtubule wall 1 protein [Petromyzon marinus]|uniref:piercer of microtubule wall 1 protein n=1 Tax=Petromyzon marinus TaxID=7757 RepID=UPI003F6F690E